MTHNLQNKLLGEVIYLPSNYDKSLASLVQTFTVVGRLQRFDRNPIPCACKVPPNNNTFFIQIITFCVKTFTFVDEIKSVKIASNPRLINCRNAV